MKTTTWTYKPGKKIKKQSKDYQLTHKRKGGHDTGEIGEGLEQIGRRVLLSRRLARVSRTSEKGGGTGGGETREPVVATKR